jgi:sarcosine oxidase, subunit beta
MTDRFDVAILGAGLFGAALAFHLTRTHSARVLALDTPEPPRSPSGTAASGGILSFQGWDPWDIALVSESAEEYLRLAEVVGEEPVRRNGGLRIARTEEGTRWLERVRHSLVRDGVEARAVSAGEIRDLVPFAEFDDGCTGLFTPDDALVDASGIRDGYLRCALRGGAVVRQSVEPAKVGRSDGDAWAIAGEVPAVAGELVVAAGAWSKPILSELGHPLPLAPFRAQLLQARPRPLLASFPTLHDLDLNMYVRPGPSARLLAGDGTGVNEEDPLRWNSAADQTFVDHTTKVLGELCRGLDSIRKETAWAGLCAASPDRFPLVGRVPGAPKLCVASGFNGFGTMRAGALARRLAEAIGTDRWEALRPADPARFHLPAEPFDPRPEFPLEVEGAAVHPPDAAASERPRGGGPVHWPQEETRFRLLHRTDEVDPLRWSSLSEWFDPLLSLFAKDALRTGGTVEVAEEDGTVQGLLLFGSSEGVSSGFTRRRRLAERYLDGLEAGGLYLEEPWRTGGEPIEVFAADLRDWEARERLRNPVRIATRDDLPEIRLLMRGELGPGVDRWFTTLPRPEETAFICEIGGRVVGVSWLSRMGAYARGHSFVVHPRFRGLGIGTDLLTSRMLWLQRTGARQVVSEIYDGNLASRTAAERAGMALVARMYHFRPTKRA